MAKTYLDLGVIDPTDPSDFKPKLFIWWGDDSSDLPSPEKVPNARVRLDSKTAELHVYDVVRDEDVAPLMTLQPWWCQGGRLHNSRKSRPEVDIVQCTGLKVYKLAPLCQDDPRLLHLGTLVQDAMSRVLVCPSVLPPFRLT